MHAGSLDSTRQAYELLEAPLTLAFFILLYESSFNSSSVNQVSKNLKLKSNSAETGFCKEVLVISSNKRDIYWPTDYFFVFLQQYITKVNAPLHKINWLRFYLHAVTSREGS